MSIWKSGEPTIFACDTLGFCASLPAGGGFQAFADLVATEQLVELSGEFGANGPRELFRGLFQLRAHLFLDRVGDSFLCQLAHGFGC